MTHDSPPTPTDAKTVDDMLAAAEGALATELAAYSPTDARGKALEDADDRDRWA